MVQHQQSPPSDDFRIGLPHLLLTGFPDHYICQTAKRLSRQRRYRLWDWEDLRQEMYLRILERLPQFDPQRGCFNAFVKMIVRQLAANLRRHCEAQMRNGGQEISLATLVAGEGGCVELAELIDLADQNRRLQRTPLSDRDEADSRLDVSAFLASLSRRHREIARLLQVLTPSEIAEKLGMHRSTIYTAIRNLRVLMAEAGLGAEHEETGRHSADSRGTHRGGRGPSRPFAVPFSHCYSPRRRERALHPIGGCPWRRRTAGRRQRPSAARRHRSE